MAHCLSPGLYAYLSFLPPSLGHLKPRFSAASRAGPQAPIPSHFQVLEGQSPALELRSHMTLVGTSLLNALMALGRWGLIHGKSLFYKGGS